MLPQVFPGILGCSTAGKALKQGIWSYELVDIRNFGVGKRKSVDDTQYGGGPGMVIRPDVLGNAIDNSLSDEINAIYYFSPKGKRIDVGIVQEIIDKKNVMFICGKFEGIDDRIIQEYNIEEVSIGDFIVSSGEICAITLLDACIRKLPGVINKKKSHLDESFHTVEGVSGILEYPLYTKPYEWKNNKVPDILLSGHHKNISEWRLKKAIEITLKKRPDLINKNNSYVSQFIKNFRE